MFNYYKAVINIRSCLNFQINDAWQIAAQNWPKEGIKIHHKIFSRVVTQDRAQSTLDG